VEVALLHQMLLQPCLDALAEQRAIGKHHGGASVSFQQAHDEGKEQVGRFLGAERWEIVLDAVFFASAERGIGEDDIHTLLLAPGNQRSRQCVVVAYETRILDAVQQHVGNAEHVGELLLLYGAQRRLHLLARLPDQNRELDPDITLRRALAPDSDSVIYQDRVIHVAAWGAKFLFDAEDLNQRVGKLSGGERARVLIAQLMLQPADVLLLDEPTNDLDIPTLEILEESLLEYRGALVLVTHDRYMLDRVSTVVLGLDGLGEAERFADYSQWEAWQRTQQTKGARDESGTLRSRGSLTGGGDGARAASKKKKLSFAEAREFETIEKRVADAEHELRAHHVALEDPAVMSDPALLQRTCKLVEEAQNVVDGLYARWAELEKKRS